MKYVGLLVGAIFSFAGVMFGYAAANLIAVGLGALGLAIAFGFFLVLINE